MTANQYRQICQQTDVLRRATIEETARLLPDYSTKLNAILSGAPIEKPALHKGTAAADRFIVHFSAEEAREITEQLLWLEADAAESLLARVTYIADLVDVCSNLTDFA